MSWRRLVVKPARVPERVIQAQVVSLLRSIGARVYVLGTVRPKGDTPGTRQSKGIPDLYAFLPPLPYTDPNSWKPVWIEVKAKGGRLRPEQAEFRDTCVKANHRHIVGGLDDVVAYLQQRGWLKAA